MSLPGSPELFISLLYVDDEPALLEIARLFLEKSAHFSVTTCECATDALQLLSESSFDAIISDYQMPGMDGIQFLTHLRKRGIDLPFIIFTGKGREEVVIQALNEGADFYLQKGGDPKAQFAELANKIRYAVSKRRSEVALRESEERYRTVVEVQHEFICRFLPDGTHIFANDAYCRYFGSDHDGIIGRKLKPPIHPDDKEKVALLYASLTPDHPSGTIEQRIVREDGRVIWQRLHTTAFFDENGLPCEYQTVGHDITDLMERDAELQRINEEIFAANEQLAAAEEELRHQVEELAAARQEVEAGREQLHLAMDAGEHGFWDWDLTTNKAYFSPRYYTMLGYEPDEFPAGFESWLSLLHPEDSKAVVPRIEACVREMQPFEEEFRLQCRDGSWKWISGRGKIYQSEPGGAPSRALGVHVDINDRKRAEIELRLKNEELAAAEEELRSQYEQLSVAEEELRSQLDEMIELQKALQRSEAEFRIVAETAPVGIALLDSDGKTLYFSPKFVELFGYTKVEISSVEDWLLCAYPETSLREQARNDWNDALDQAKGTGSETRMLEYPIRCRDGRIRQIEFRAARAGERIVVLFVDVTERKAAEDALRASRQEMKIILDAMPVGVTYIDPDYRIRYSNNHSALSSDMHPHELIGRYCYEVRYGRSTPCEDCIVVKAMKTEKIEEGMRVLPGGSVFHLKGCPVHDTAGNLDGVIEFGLDITEQQEIEDSLRESEEKYRTLFDIMQPGVFYQRADGSLVDANISALKMLGLSREEFLKRDSYHPSWKIIREDGSLLAPEEHPSMVAFLTGETVHGTVVGIHNAVSDQYIWVSVDAIPLKKPDSAVPYQVFVTMNDITGRKQMEDSLRENEEKYRLIAENTADNIWIFDMDFRLQYISPSVEKLKGFSVEESLVQSVQDMMTPASYTNLLARFNEEMAREGTADPDRIVYFETEEYHKAGAILKIENSARLLRDTEGRPVAILGISRDITGRKRMEESLRKSEEKYRILVEMAQEGIWAIDADEVTTYVNPRMAEMLGYTVDEMIGSHLEAFMDEEGREDARNNLALGRKGITKGYEFTYIRKDGGRIYTNISTAPLINVEGEYLGAMAVVSDVTDRKHAEEALRQANKQLKILSGITRHDIKNKISVVLGYIELARGRTDDPELIDYINEMKSAIDTVHSQIDFTRVYQDLGSTDPQWQRLEQLTRDLAIPKGISFLNHAEPVSIYADPLLRNVFSTLLDNSLRHGRDVQTITVRTIQSDGGREPGKGLEIIWEDDGGGIPDHEKEKIFEKGYGKNTGFGLFLAREILSFNGLDIRETGKSGEGARFEIFVPEPGWRREEDLPAH